MPRKNLIKRECNYCNSVYQAIDLRSKFCSRSCAARCNNRKRILTPKTKKRISNSVKELHAQGVYEHRKRKKKIHLCKCGQQFEGHCRKGRTINCDKCKRKTKKKEGSFCLLELSKRTQQKILRRAGKGCQICGWNEASCHLHHIIWKSQGGTNENKNIIVLCPNHHAIVHDNPNKYSLDYLRKRSIANTFKDWKIYYNSRIPKQTVVDK